MSSSGKRKKERVKERSARQEKRLSFTERLKAGWITKYPVLLFVVVFAILMGSFYVFWLTHFFEQNIFNPVVSFNAKAAAAVLNIFGQETTAFGDSIISSKFSISVRRGCDALEPTALFVSAVLAFPAPFRTKIPAVVAGAVLLLSINLIRIISLFLVGVFYPKAFEIMHIEVWQIIFIILAIVCWAVWIQWAIQIPKQKENVLGQTN